MRHELSWFNTCVQFAMIDMKSIRYLIVWLMVDIDLFTALQNDISGAGSRPDAR